MPLPGGRGVSRHPSLHSIQELLVVLPFLKDRLVRIKPALLAALAQDAHQTAGRVIALKNLLPRADLVQILVLR
jgi:hypothetical protein